MDDTIKSEFNSTRRRLAPVERDRRLLPFRRADRLVGMSVYWLPIAAFSVPVTQRTWILEFLERLSKAAARELKFQEQIFFQMKATIEDKVRKPFFNNQYEFVPMPGLSRKPGTKPPAEPTSRDVEDIQAGRKKFETDMFIPDYCCWFLGRCSTKIRSELFGYGAMTIAYVAPDPALTQPTLPNLRVLRENPVMKQINVQAKIDMAFSLKHRFLPLSKERFGADLQEDYRHKDLLYILPRLSSGDFFSQPREEAQGWFEVFPLYVTESVADRGLLLASNLEFDDLLIELLEGMVKDGLVYPEDGR